MLVTSIGAPVRLVTVSVYWNSAPLVVGSALGTLTTSIVPTVGVADGVPGVSAGVAAGETVGAVGVADGVTGVSVGVADGVTGVSVGVADGVTGVIVGARV